jgi:hypothetical protein
MKKLVLYTTLLVSSYSFATVNSTICKHDSTPYAEVAGIGNCPKYVGTDIGLPAGWTHVHNGDGTDPHHEKAGEIPISDDTDHCTINKVYIYEQGGSGNF